MDPIIRAAAIGTGTRQLRRAERAGSAAPVTPVVPIAAPSNVATATQSSATISALERQVKELQARLAEQSAGLAEERLALGIAAKRDAEKLRADAEQRGLAAGEAAGAALAKEQVARFTSIAATLSHARGKVIDEAEDDLVEIIFTALTRMLGDVLVTRTAVIAMVESLCADARDSGALSVRLHPDDLALLRTGADSAGVEARLCLVGDAAVRLGGCFIDSPAGTLDARIETQLDRLRLALIAVREQRRNVEVPI